MIQNISGLPQGPVHPFGGRLNWAPRRTSMSEQAIEERRGWASDIVWVVVYSILVLLVMLLWVIRPGLKDTAVPGWQPPAAGNHPTREGGSRSESPGVTTRT